MAVQILAGLARVGATAGRAAATGARAGARAAARGAKKLAVKKGKSFAKDKLKGKAKDLRYRQRNFKPGEGGTDSGERHLQAFRDFYGLSSPSPLIGGTTNPSKIKPAKSSDPQVKQLKVNVTNIHRFLVKSNNDYTRQQATTRRNQTVQRSKAKLGGEERRLGKRSSPLAKSASIVKGAMKPAGSLFDRIMEFAGTLLLGILVNALPAIVEKVKEVIDNLVNFFTPIQSGFNVIMSLFSDDINQDQLDVDKKRFDDGIQNIQGEGGLLDKIKEKMGPFGGAIDLLKGAIDKFRDVLGLKKASTKMKLEKRDGKEGFVNTETGQFTERQFTSAERKQYESQGKNPTSSPDNKPIGSQISTPIGPITPGGTLDFIGSGDGASGTLVLKDQKGKKLGSWEAISGVFRTANASQEDRRNVSGTLNPLPDGTYPLMGFAKHGYVDGVGTWSTYINNMTGSIGSRSQLLVHSDIGSNGTAGCVGVELGGRSGTDAEKKFLKLYEAAKPTSIRVAIGKGANKLSAPRRSTDNTPVTAARINSVDKKSQQMDSINQSMDDEGTTTIAVQQVNTIRTQVVPTPVKVASAPPQPAPVSQLTSIWTF